MTQSCPLKKKKISEKKKFVILEKKVNIFITEILCSDTGLKKLSNQANTDNVTPGNRVAEVILFKKTSK